MIHESAALFNDLLQDRFSKEVTTKMFKRAHKERLLGESIRESDMGRWEVMREEGKKEWYWVLNRQLEKETLK